jgi:hypothetical protein
MDKLAWLNSFISQRADFSIKEEFRIVGEVMRGCVLLDTETKETLIFDVEIPVSYPLIERGKKCCRFVVQNNISCLHINPDRSICLVVPTNFDFKKKFETELELLIEWRDRYYLGNHIDDKYDYPILPNQKQVTFLFTDLNKIVAKHKTGVVHGWLYPNFSTKVKCPVYMVSRFDQLECEWSSKNKEESVLGLYYFIDQEPSSGNGFFYSSWKELERYFTTRFKEKLFNIQSNTKGYKGFLFIGYRIRDTQEIHWLAIELNSIKNFVKKWGNIKRFPGFVFTDERINWLNTTNVSYNRFYGRGSISQNVKK